VLPASVVRGVRRGVAFFYTCLIYSSHLSAASKVIPRYVAAWLGWTSMSLILTISIILDLVLDWVKWISWYFASKNFNP
jgi:hypothetical protein